MTEPDVRGAGPEPGPGRDPRLAGFAEGGVYGRSLPSAAVTGVLEDLADGTGRPPPQTTDDEMIGMLSCWQAAEAHSHARMLAVLRELIRRRAADGVPAACRGDLPGQWDKGAACEAAAELGIGWQAAAPLLHLAWELQARLPGTGRLLDEGVITAFKARIVSDEFGLLDDEKAAEAERLLLENDLGAASMTPGRLRRLCQQISDTVDPEGARKRREDAQRERARVSFFRAHGGDTAMFAEGLPADDALMAQRGIQARALDYRAAGIYPDATMDLLRVLAMLDLINQAALEDRIARYQAGLGADPPVPATDPPGGRPATGWPGGEPAPEDGGAPADAEDPDEGSLPYEGSPEGEERPEDEQPPPDEDSPEGEGGSGRGPDSGGPGGGPGSGGPNRGGPGGASGGAREPGLPSLVNLTLPLATLTGLADRPGEVPGFGSVDAGLVRELGAVAAGSPRSRWCFTVTDADGHAAGHACARLIPAPRDRGTSGRPGRAGPAPGGWDLQPDPGRTGPEGGYGAWILTVPGGARFRLDVHPVPLHDCDHRFATDAYRPGKLLRHLVEIRDGECSFTGCSHPARQCDYEHSTAWLKGGETDACNASPMSRNCHQVKQKRGWSVSQPEPGRHVWHTPSGRTYEKGAKSYPA